MIDDNLVTMAIGGTIVGSGLFPRVSWANKDSALELPYLSLSLVPTGIADGTLDQSSPVWSGFMQAAIVTGLDEYETEGSLLRHNLAGLFLSGARFALTDGTTIMVARHPQPQKAYRDGPNYRLPLQIFLSSDTI